MPSGEAAALIAGASAVGGGAIVAVSNYAVGVLQARGRTVRFINEQMARLPQIDYTIGRARRRLFEPHLDAFAIELAQAMTAASMLAPLRLLPAMEALANAMSSMDASDDVWRERWNAARTSYFVECRKLLGSGVVDRQDGRS